MSDRGLLIKHTTLQVTNAPQCFNEMKIPLKTTRLSINTKSLRKRQTKKQQ